MTVADACTEVRANVALALLREVQVCERRGLSRARIARRSGVASLGHILGGKENLTLDTITKLARAMGLRISLVLSPSKIRAEPAPPLGKTLPTYHSIHAIIARAALPEIRRRNGELVRSITAKQLLQFLVEASGSWIKTDEVAARAGMSKTVVRETLPVLEQAGLLLIDRRQLRDCPRGHARHRYQVNVDRLRQLIRKETAVA